MELDSYLSEKQKKRRKRRRYIFILLVCLVIYALSIGAAWVLFRAPWFRIKAVVIEGNATVPDGAVTDLLRSHIINGGLINSFLGFNNILAWPDALNGKDLISVPVIKSLKIGKNYRAMAISVNVVERQPYGIWCLASPQTYADPLRRSFSEASQTQNNADSYDIPRQSALSLPAGASAQAGSRESAPEECWWFDRDGVLFKHALAAEGGFVTAVHDYSQNGLGLSSSILPQDFIAGAFSIFEVLKLSGLGVEEIRLDDLAKQEFEVLTYGGPKIYFSLRFPANNTLAVIQNLMSKPGFNELEYVDFRVENRAYYK